MRQLEVDAVVVGKLGIGEDLDALEDHAVAVGHPVAPAGGRVDEGDVLDQHVLAAGEEDHPRRTELAGDAAVLPVHPLVLAERLRVRAGVALVLVAVGEAVGELDERHAVAVDFAAAGERDVAAAVGDDERGGAAARGLARVEDGAGNVGREVRVVLRAEQRGIDFDVEVDAVLQEHHPGEERPLRQHHPAAAGLGAGVDRLLDRDCVLGRAVALRAECARVEVPRRRGCCERGGECDGHGCFHGSAPFGG